MGGQCHVWIRVAEMVHLRLSPCHVYQKTCSPGSVLPPMNSDYSVGEPEAFQAFIHEWETWLDP